MSFCYLQNYDQADDYMNSEPDKIARKHLGGYLAADKFCIFPLRTLASRRIADWAKSNWALECFPDIAQDVWCNTPPHENELRNAIIEVVSSNIQHFLTKDNANNVLIENPEFTIAVLKRMAESNIKLKEQNNKLIEQSNALGMQVRRRGLTQF